MLYYERSKEAIVFFFFYKNVFLDSKRNIKNVSILRGYFFFFCDHFFT